MIKTNFRSVFPSQKKGRLILTEFKRAHITLLTGECAIFSPFPICMLVHIFDPTLTTITGVLTVS